jgi:hypothetical protein
MEKYYYIVSHSISETGTIDTFITEDFAEAVEVISRTTNWYESLGSGYIRKVDRNMNVLEEWAFRHNEVSDHWVWKK